MCLPQVSPTDQAVAAPLPAGGVPHSTHGEQWEATVTISIWNWRPEHMVRQGQATFVVSIIIQTVMSVIAWKIVSTQDQIHREKLIWC
jgi:hypothetical protein